MFVTVETERSPEYPFLPEANAIGLTAQKLRNEGEGRLRTALDSEFWRKQHLRELAEQKLMRFAEWKENWDSYGAPAPNATALKNALRIAKLLLAPDLERANIVPSAEGGIGFSFSVDDRYADIECSNEGDFLGVRYSGMETPVLIDLDGSDRSIQSALEEIRKHVRG